MTSKKMKKNGRQPKKNGKKMKTTNNKKMENDLNKNGRRTNQPKST